MAYVIAEVGASHDGLHGRALELVSIAAQVGANCVKFQYFGDPEAIAARRHLASGWMYERYTTREEWLPSLHERAKGLGLDFACTVYRSEDVPAVDPYVDVFKVSAFEALDRDLLKACIDAEGDRSVFVSLGMGTTEADVIDVLSPDGMRGVRLLHCVSCYPAPHDQLNLTRIKENLLDGFSDHSLPHLTWTGALAVASGAAAIEAHLRLDSTLPDNPDFPHSMTPAQFAEYVKHINFAEDCCGPAGDLDRPRHCERSMMAHRVGSSRGEEE